MNTIKNFTMHDVELSMPLQKKWKIEDPGFDKKWMILSSDAIIRGKSTTYREQRILMKRIAPYINKGDNILVAGHSTLVTSVETVARIRGANVYVGYLHKDTRRIIKIDKKIISENDLNRADRFEIEHAKGE